MNTEETKTPVETPETVETAVDTETPKAPEISLEEIKSLKDMIQTSTEALKASTEAIKNIQEQNAAKLKELTKSYEEQMTELRNSLPYKSYGEVNIQGYYDFNKVENKFYMDQTNKDREKGLMDLRNLVANF